MTKVIKLPVHTPEKLGNRRIRKKRKPDLEDFGQLNLFESIRSRVISLPGEKSFFEEALRLDEESDIRAEQFYLLAVENGECVEDSLCNLAVLKSAQDDKISAINFLTQCLQNSPRHFEAHYNLGNVYSDLGNFSLARAHYELAIQIAPNYPNSFYNLGLVLISLKEYKKALENINNYIDLSPGADTGNAKELITTLKAIAL